MRYLTYVVLIIIVIRPEVYADEWQMSIHGLYSQYTGVLGAEFQNNHFAITVGVPPCLGMKYYFTYSKNSWYVGAHITNYYSEDEKKDGIEYDEKDDLRYGSGFGYKWYFLKQWHLNVGCTLFYNKEKYTNDNSAREDENIRLYPDITFGYTF